MRFSIIIVCYRDYASLDKCIASVRSSGIKDYEIIVWENTPPPIFKTREEYENRFRPPSYGARWCGANENIGFAAGCNAAAKNAQGDLLIFLNPDTLVFGNWADDLAKGIQDKFVAVGPVSNFVAGFQQVERYGGEDKGLIETKLLIGFCLMIRRDVFEELGGMDEKLFLGCDDLDLSWRLQRAGYRMCINTGVFVHHEGHTSMNMNPEKDKLIKQSEKAMRDKLAEFYGEDVPTSEELWGCKIMAPSLKRQRLSVCMIAPDDRKPEFWFADQVVCLNVGDSIENFAEVRNKALAMCTGDWVLWLDTDDVVPAESAALIDALIHKPGNNVALQACHFAFKVENTDKDGEVRDSFYQSRLFPRLPDIKWGGVGGCHGYVHENYSESCQALGLPMVQTNITIRHTGYSDRVLEIKKAERNLALLLKEPDNCFKWYNVGCSYMAMGDNEKALEGYRKALEFSEGEDPYFVDNCRYNVAMSLYKQGKNEEAIPYLEPNRKPDSKWLLGMLLIDSEREKACDLLWAYLKMGDIKDNLGTNCPAFRKAAIQTLGEIGIIK